MVSLGKPKNEKRPISLVVNMFLLLTLKLAFDNGSRVLLSYVIPVIKTDLALLLEMSCPKDTTFRLLNTNRINTIRFKLRLFMAIIIDQDEVTII